MNAQELVESLDTQQLKLEASALMAWEMGVVNDAEGVAQFMYRGGPFPPQASVRGPRGEARWPEDRRPEKKYWEFVRDEMCTFLCTDDMRYRELWRRINALEKNAKTSLVPVIAAFLGQLIGAPATLLAGFVAVCLYAVAKLGTEAYCRYASQNRA